MKPMSAAPKPAPDPIEALSSLLRVVPVHSLAARERGRIGVVRGRGSRPGIAVAPVIVEDDYNSRVDELRHEAVKQDQVVASVNPEKRADPTEVVYHVAEALARECAALKFDRRMGERVGKNMEQTSSRTVDGYAKIASLVIEARKIGVITLDRNSPAMLRVEALWLELVRDAAVEMLKEPWRELLLDRVREAMVNWREQFDQDCRNASGSL
jgi:hypothetical protein